MSACSQPPVETILRSCIATLQSAIMPELQSDWARYSGGLLVGSLEYALGLLNDKQPDRHRQEVGAALEQLAPVVEAAGGDLIGSFDLALPYDTASALLIHALRHPGPTADQIHALLHPLLFRQLEEDLQAASPLLRAGTLPRRTTDAGG